MIKYRVFQADFEVKNKRNLCVSAKLIADEAIVSFSKTIGLFSDYEEAHQKFVKQEPSTRDCTGPAGHFLRCTAFVLEEVVVETDENGEEEITEFVETLAVRAQGYKDPWEGVA